MLDALLIDDDQKSLDLMLSLLENYCPDIIVSGYAKDFLTAEALIKNTQPDILLLETEISDGSAFVFLDNIAATAEAELVFVTAFEKHAVKAYEYNVAGYLVKPLNARKLQLAIKKADNNIVQKRYIQRVSNMDSATLNPLEQRLALPMTNVVSFLTINEIVYCKAKGAYTEIHTYDKRVLTVTQSIKEYEKLLPEIFFCRVHHSYIVNINCIRNFYKGRGGYLELNNGMTIEVSARRKVEFLARFGIR